MRLGLLLGLLLADGWLSGCAHSPDHDAYWERQRQIGATSVSYGMPWLGMTGSDYKTPKVHIPHRLK